MLVVSDFLCIFAPKINQGALAHLARALDWQSKGDEFESRMLHNITGFVKRLGPILHYRYRFFSPWH